MQEKEQKGRRTLIVKEKKSDEEDGRGGVKSGQEEEEITSFALLYISEPIGIQGKVTDLFFFYFRAPPM